MEIMKTMDDPETLEVDQNLKRDYMKVAERLTEEAQDAKSLIRKNIKSARTYVRDNPGKALGIAAGVGAVAGLVFVKTFSRRKSVAERVLTKLFRTGEDTWDHVRSGIKSSIKDVKKSDQA